MTNIIEGTSCPPKNNPLPKIARETLEQTLSGLTSISLRMTFLMSSSFLTTRRRYSLTSCRYWQLDNHLELSLIGDGNGFMAYAIVPTIDKPELLIGVSGFGSTPAEAIASCVFKFYEVLGSEPTSELVSTRPSIG